MDTDKWSPKEFRAEISCGLGFSFVRLAFAEAVANCTISRRGTRHFVNYSIGNGARLPLHISLFYDRCIFRDKNERFYIMRLSLLRVIVVPINIFAVKGHGTSYVVTIKSQDTES